MRRCKASYGHSLFRKGEKMILSVDTNIIRNAFGDEKAFEVLRESGFTGVDFSFHERPKGEAFDPVKAKELLDKNGLSCLQTHGPDNFDAKLQMSESERTYKEVCDAIVWTRILGAKVMALHSLYIPWVSKEEEWKRNLSYFKSFEPILMENNVMIGVENLPLQVTDTPEDINRFIEELESPYYGALLDTGHGRISGIEPHEYIRRLKPGSLVGIHVQDQHGKKDEHIIPYMGETDWAAFADALREAGYKGPMSLEIVHFMEKVPKELLPAAHKYAASVGEYLIRMFSS